MQVGIGYGDHPDSMIAGKQAIQMALSKTERTEPCDLILLFCTAAHNQQLLRDAIVSVVGDSQRIFGGGAAGVITNDYFGYAGDQVGVACIWLDESQCTVLSEKGLVESEVETGKRLGKQLLDAGITPNTSAMLFYDAIDRSNDGMRLLMATPLLEGLEKGMGFLPLLMGAGLQGDHACTPTLQYTGGGMDAHSAISLVFSDDICIDSIIMHGCRPASPYYTVTKASGPVILEINNRPALEFMDEVLDSAIAPEDYPFFLLFGLNHGDPWGEYDESNYASRLCLAIDKECGGIVMFEPDMVAGTVFQIMFRSLDLNYMKPKIEKIFGQLEEKETLFALYIDCAGRCAGYGGVDIEDALVIQQAVGKKVPLLGIYTGAEIAPMGGRSRGLDLTGVFCLFSKRKSTDNPKNNSNQVPLWNSSTRSKENPADAPSEAILRLCEKNAAKVLALDSQSIAIRHELEQKRRGFSLLAELSVSLREGITNEDVFLPLTQRINSALNMQKTAVLFPNAKGQFSSYVLQGYSPEEKETLLGKPIEVPPELLNPENPVLVTALHEPEYLATFRKTLGLPYFIAAPVVIKNDIAALLITGRMIESEPFLARLGRSDVETVQAISSLLASVLVYRKLDVANRQAQSDVLTGLLNRGALETRVTQRLNTELEKGKTFAFFIIDCDYFKDINDRYGHMEGDMVLNSLSQFLKNMFDPEAFIARIGGDEFVVFCTLSDGEAGLLNQAAALVKNWEETLLTPKAGTSFHSTVSIGISFAPRDGSTYDTLFQNADIALYKSKDLGRNQYTCYDEKTMKGIFPSAFDL